MQKDNRAGLMNHGLLFIKCNRVNDCRHSRKRAGILCQCGGRGEYFRGDGTTLSVVTYRLLRPTNMSIFQFVTFAAGKQAASHGEC